MTEETEKHYLVTYFDSDIGEDVSVLIFGKESEIAQDFTELTGYPDDFHHGFWSIVYRHYYLF